MMRKFTNIFVCLASKFTCLNWDDSLKQYVHIMLLCVYFSVKKSLWLTSMTIFVAPCFLIANRSGDILPTYYKTTHMYTNTEAKYTALKDWQTVWCYRGSKAILGLNAFTATTLVTANPLKHQQRDHADHRTIISLIMYLLLCHRNIFEVIKSIPLNC